MKTIEVFESKEEAYEVAKKLAEEDAKGNYLEGEVEIEFLPNDGVINIQDTDITEAILSHYKVCKITKNGEAFSVGFIILSAGDDYTAFIFSEEIGVWL